MARSKQRQMRDLLRQVEDLGHFDLTTGAYVVDPLGPLAIEEAVIAALDKLYPDRQRFLLT